MILFSIVYTPYLVLMATMGTYRICYRHYHISLTLGQDSMVTHDRSSGIASGTLRLVNEEPCSYLVLIIISYNQVYFFLSFMFFNYVPKHAQDQNVTLAAIAELIPEASP